MRERLETLSLVQLKELARQEGYKGISTMKKSDLVDFLLVHVEEKKKKERPVQKPIDSSVDTKTVKAVDNTADNWN